MKHTIIASLWVLMTAVLSGCRTDKPPVISIICMGDGLGGADCVMADGTRVYRSPSQLAGFWMTTQTDEANFAGWCYKVPPPTAALELVRIQAMIKAEAPRS